MTVPRAALDEATSIEDVQRVLRTTVRTALAAHGATLVLLDGDQCYYADEDSMSPLWKGQRFPAHTCISGWAMHHEQTVAIHDIRSDPRIPQAAYRPTFVRSLLVSPILHPDPIGALGAYWATHHHATDKDVATLQDIARAAGEALERFPEGVPARGLFA
jgi:GAF domain-containing protein